MPMQSVTLRPGVDIEKSPTLNEAGISQSQLIRTKNGLTQTVGGWQQFGTMTIPSTVKDLHAWQDINATDYLGAGATGNLVAMTATSYTDITPQTRISSVAPNVSISSGSNIVQIADVNSAVTVLDSVVFNTPISIGNLLLQGAYPIASVLSTGSYTIVSSISASTTIGSSGVLPTFTTALNSALVTVSQANHTAQAILGIQQTYLAPTTVGGITILGAYNVSSVATSTTYTFFSPTVATAVASTTMNNGLAQYEYHVTVGSVPGGGGYGGGAYGGGGYGTGLTSTGVDGTPITATDWTMDNWGEILVACAKDSHVYQWSPNLGVANAAVIPQAPIANGGMFISMPQQIMVCWKSTQTLGLGPGLTQDNLIVRWSDAQDFTNWDVSELTLAGSFHIPTGSVIRGGLQAANYGVIWTDVDVWIMQFIGPTAAFNFTRAASGCGLIGTHAAAVLAGVVWWMGESNFYALSGQGVEVLPCTVWDFVFQNINTAAKEKVCCEPNSLFNEITWSFPSGTNTENDSYVKYNLLDKTWDFGMGGLSRTAWTDVSVIGNPVGTDTSGVVYQHELGNMISGAGNSSFKTGYWAINDGQELGFVDWVFPDFIWGIYGDTSGSIQLQFFSTDYPGDTPRTYGPYTVTQANQYITPRIRGRLMAMEVISASNNVFWRLGRIRFRWSASGRR